MAQPPSVVVRARAPLRVSFAGGGTDVPPFPAQEGGLVLSATINRYAYGSLTPRADDQLAIESLDLGLAVSYGLGDLSQVDAKLALVKGAVARLADGRGTGFELLLHTAAPPGSGLGASSAMMVTLIGVLKEHYGLSLTDYDIAHLAYTVEREDLGLKGGLQDQYAATFGGFNFIEFEADRVLVNPLRVRADVVNELEYNLLLVFTGATRAGDQIIKDQTSRYEDHEARALEGLRMQKRLAGEMKDALLRGNLDTFGSLLGTAWDSKKKMSPKISNSFIDEAYDLAVRNGALGGKVTGAGGGGYMLFYCDYRRKHRVAEALTKLGATVTDFAFEPDGLRTWRYAGA